VQHQIRAPIDTIRHPSTTSTEDTRKAITEMTPDPLAARPTASEVSPPSAQATPEPPRPLGAFDVPLRTIAFADIGRWLAAGARDFRRLPLIGLFYGACFVSMGWALLAVFDLMLRHPDHVFCLRATMKPSATAL
jgi:hypothetical protein